MSKIYGGTHLNISRKKIALVIAAFILLVVVLGADGLFRKYHEGKNSEDNTIVAAYLRLPVFSEAGSIQQIVPSGAVGRGSVISYYSMDEKVAVVDMKGNVTAISPGKTEIIVEENYKGDIVKHTIEVCCEW